MRPILSGLLIFISLYIFADFFVKNATIGLSSSAVNTKLFGNMDEFIDPMMQSVFLEHLHTETFFIMMILLTLSAVFMRLFAERAFALTLLNITMLSALLSLIAIGLSYYVTASFVHLYVISFFVWHIAALLMSLLSLWRLFRA